MRAIDSVQIHGWTSETVQRAVAALGNLVHKAGTPTSENDELAAELVRWLQCAVREDGTHVAEQVEELRPEGQEASPWDRLESFLADDSSLTELSARLRAEYSDTVHSLCMLLTEKVPRFQLWQDVDRCYQRAVEVLLDLGTRESLSYLLAHVDLLLGALSDSLVDLIRRHHEVFPRLAVDVWPRLSWHGRGSLALFFSEHKLQPGRLVELLLAVDPETLSHEDRAELVEALVYTDDSKAELAIHRIIESGLDEVSRHRCEESVGFVSTALHWLIHEMERELPAQQHERAIALGFDVPQPIIH